MRGVVGVDGGVGIESHIVRLVVEACGILDLNVRAAVGIDSLRLVGKCNGIDEGMVTGDALASHLETVAVAGVDLAAVVVQDITVLICHGILYDDLTDRSVLNLREKIPAIIGVICGNAAVEDISVSYGKLRREAVRVLIALIRVLHGGAVQDEIVCRPFIKSISPLVTADLKTCVTVFVGLDELDDIVVSGDLQSLFPVLGACDVKALKMPIIACKGHSCVLPTEIYNRSRGGIRVSEKIDRLLFSPVYSALDDKSVFHLVSALKHVDSLPGNCFCQCCGQAHGLFLGSRSVRCPVRRHIDSLCIIYREIHCVAEGDRFITGQA